MTRTARDRGPVRIMYVGLALTAALMLAPIVDLLTADTIAEHVRATYPHWSQHKIDEDRDAIAGWLAGVGLLGLATWCWAILVVRRQARRTRLVVSSAFALGLIVVMINLSTGGHGYQQIVPLQYGLLSLVPSVVGLIAVVRVWRPAGAGCATTVCVPA